MNVKPFFDDTTSTLTYVAWSPGSHDAVVIDPVLDYDPLRSQTTTSSVDAVAAFLRQMHLRLHWVLETHAHADHLSGARLLRRHFDARVAIGAGITEVQRTFKQLHDLPPDFATDGRQFDQLLRHGERLEAGALIVETIATPGHTPGCVSYRIGDRVFTGDALFIEDYGTGRTDFPGGSAHALWVSITEHLYRLPARTRVHPGHDYRPAGRPMRWESTIAAERGNNVHLNDETKQEDFVVLRRRRDAELEPPRLLHQSIQVNIAGGRLPHAHDNGRRYLKIPLNHLQHTDDIGEPG